MNQLVRIKLPAVLENLAQFTETVIDCARMQGLGKKRLSQIRLALEEALVNIFNYAYPNRDGDAEVVCSIDHRGWFVVEITDWGDEFNILSLGEPDLSADISKRPVGGLGVFLIRKFMDDVNYRFEDDKNILTLFIDKNSGDV